MDKQEHQVPGQEERQTDRQVPEQEEQKTDRQVTEQEGAKTGMKVTGEEDVKAEEHLEEEKAATDKESEHKARKPGKHAPSKAREDILKLENSLNELQDKYLRLSAEFDNYRKRTLKEKMDWSRDAGEEIFTRMLPVLDDLERALVHIREGADMEAIKQGVELIYNKLKDFLNQQGINEIVALNEEFDTDRHEAVTKIPAPDPAMKGKIMDVIQRGYMLNEKVIRFAKVVIGE